MKPFLDSILAGKVRLVCNGAALPVVRPGPDIRSTLQLIVDAVRQSDPQTFTITIAAGDALLGAETVTMRNVVTYCQTLIRQSESVYGKSEYRDPATPFVAPVFKQGQATRTICNVCGGVGHYGRDCATSKVLIPPADDGTRKSEPADRRYKNRHSTDGDQPPNRTNIKKVKREFVWTPKLGPCHWCGADHLNAHCKKPEGIAGEAGRKAARAAKRAAGATPAALFVFDEASQAAATDEDAALFCAPCAPPDVLRQVPAGTGTPAATVTATGVPLTPAAAGVAADPPPGGSCGVGIYRHLPPPPCRTVRNGGGAPHLRGAGCPYGGRRLR